MAYADLMSIARTNAANAKGYSQERRMSPNEYDCSSFVARNLNQAGIRINPELTTHSMSPDSDVMRKAGFEWHPGMDGVEEGDILWKQGHTEFYAGNGRTLGAHSKKNGVSEYNMSQKYDGYWKFVGDRGTPTVDPNSTRPSAIPIQPQGFINPLLAQSSANPTVQMVQPQQQQVQQGNGFAGYRVDPRIAEALIGAVNNNNAQIARMASGQGLAGLASNLNTGVRYNPVGLGFGA